MFDISFINQETPKRTSITLQASEKELENLQKENFSLRLRVFYLEERLSDTSPNMDISKLARENAELRAALAEVQLNENPVVQFILPEFEQEEEEEYEKESEDKENEDSEEIEEGNEKNKEKKEEIEKEEIESKDEIADIEALELEEKKTNSSIGEIQQKITEKEITKRREKENIHPLCHHIEKEEKEEKEDGNNNGEKNKSINSTTMPIVDINMMMNSKKQQDLKLKRLAESNRLLILELEEKRTQIVAMQRAWKRTVAWRENKM